jgi:hypothetical protein
MKCLVNLHSQNEERYFRLIVKTRKLYELLSPKKAQSQHPTLSLQRWAFCAIALRVLHLLIILLVCWLILICLSQKLCLKRFGMEPFWLKAISVRWWKVIFIFRLTRSIRLIFSPAIPIRRVLGRGLLAITRSWSMAKRIPMRLGIIPNPRMRRKILRAISHFGAALRLKIKGGKLTERSDAR